MYANELYFCMYIVDSYDMIKVIFLLDSFSVVVLLLHNQVYAKIRQCMVGHLLCILIHFT